MFMAYAGMLIPPSLSLKGPVQRVQLDSSYSVSLFIFLQAQF